MIIFERCKDKELLMRNGGRENGKEQSYQNAAKEILRLIGGKRM